MGTSDVNLPGVAVFGTGRSSRTLIPLLRKEGYVIEAIWGQTTEEAASVASRLGIPYSTNKIDDILLKKNVDLVVVLCPPSHHSQIAVKALGIGKHVSVQAPAGLNQEETLRMVQASQYYPRLTSTLNTPCRFHPAFAKMKKLISNGFLGAEGVLHIDARIQCGPLLDRSYSWLCDDAMGGGILNLYGAHLIDLITHLTGAKAARVHGVARTLVTQTPNICGIRQIKSDDLATFQMELTSGVLATVTLNAQLSGFQQEVHLVGSEGYLVARNGDLYGKKSDSAAETPLLVGQDTPPTDAPTEDNTADLLPPMFVTGLREMFRHLAANFRREDNAMNSGATPTTDFATFEDGQYAQAVMEAVRTSSRDKTWTKVMTRAKETASDIITESSVSPKPSIAASSAGAAAAVAMFSHRRRLSLMPSNS